MERTNIRRHSINMKLYAWPFTRMLRAFLSISAIVLLSQCSSVQLTPNSDPRPQSESLDDKPSQ
jgi:hypothetical protein